MATNFVRKKLFSIAITNLRNKGLNDSEIIKNLLSQLRASKLFSEVEDQQGALQETYDLIQNLLLEIPR